jgi:hypothetical protein
LRERIIPICGPIRPPKLVILKLERGGSWHPKWRTTPKTREAKSYLHLILVDEEEEGTVPILISKRR